MERKINSYKRKYDRELRHIKIILLNNRERMTPSRWLVFVNITRQLILANAADFFSEIPEKRIFVSAINKVFEGFLEDHKIRAAQRRNTY